jgi:hypothetical protein
VTLSRASIPGGAHGGLALAFPGPAPDAEEPIALLSFAQRGDMKFAEGERTANRALFLREAGIDPGDALGLELSHSRRFLFPERGDDVAALARAAGGADGLILRDRTLAATVTVADCMPIWLLDRGSGAFGLLHSGWRGTGILALAVEALVERLGSNPASIAAVLGPAIGPCCYSVPEARAAEFAAEFGEVSVARRDGSWFLDLRAANVSLAERAGIGHLLSIEACTSCDERLGSFRRQGPANFARMLAVCGRSTRMPDILSARSIA